MLHEMGIETGIALERLLEAARAVREVLGRPLGCSRADGRPGRLARPSALRIRSRALAGIWWSATAWSRIGLASSWRLLGSRRRTFSFWRSALNASRSFTRSPARCSHFARIWASVG